jgi:ABC-type antimicrobial peptide transport system permease subunit
VRVALPALVEGWLIGIAGSALGALIAWLVLQFLAALVPLEWLRGARADFTNAGFTFAFAVGTGICVLAAAVGVGSGRGQSSLLKLAGGGRSGWSRRASGLAVELQRLGVRFRGIDHAAAAPQAPHHRHLRAASASLLAGVGWYAVMAVTVAARQHEFGVRAAMGAQPEDLLRMVLRESGVQLGLGLLIGLLVTFAAARAIAKMFGVNAADPLAIVTVFAVLSVAGLLASLSPARRAARTHPMQVLRAQ